MDHAAIKAELERRSKILRVAERIRVGTALTVCAVGLGLYAWTNATGAEIRNAGNLNLVNAVVACAVWGVWVWMGKMIGRAEDIADPSFAGYFVEGAYGTSASMRTTCEQILIRLLPKMTIADADFLDAYQWRLLYKILDQQRLGPLGLDGILRPSNKQLAGAVLGFVRRAGGAEAIPFLESFHERTRKTRDSGWQSLAQTALEALPEVRMRAARKLIDERISAMASEEEARQEEDEAVRLSLGA